MAQTCHIINFLADIIKLALPANFLALYYSHKTREFVYFF